MKAQPDQLVRIEELAAETGRTKGTVSERMNKPDAPTPWLELGRVRLWIREEAVAYLGPKQNRGPNAEN